MIATGYVSVTIDAFALIVVVIGSAEAAFNAVRHMFDSENNHRKREVWLRYARWLVAALTFQLAADIIETSIAPTWDDVGRFAVIAIIRTLLNYFLEKDLGEVRDRQRQMICSSSE
jgi:uncharacterized membrane protein